ncbi:CCC motif membrane protein [Kordia algicida OT-1]|uniref:DUF4190 domain-containing protein n=1 Tax=Kordia algicida OT-1 TaxID=391587 RepID=A9DUQ3_9FLAO|nr:CCC motif membrane protein [Kordia algicida]EDP96319.1 hypothetical protein KAOT1_02882 [Kordia algicida OT-1]
MENRKLPNDVLIIILGILSIVGCCFWGVVGLVLGLVTLYLASNATKIYQQNPDGYDNYSNIKIGRVLAIIGIVLSVLYLLLMIWMIATFGWEAMQDQEEMRRLMEEKFGQ